MIKTTITMLVIISTITCAYADIPETERQVLIDLYNSTNGDNWDDKTGWLGEVGTECNWFGVSCNREDTHVVSMHFGVHGNNLSGEIPQSISNLNQLTFLYFDSNKLTGVSSTIGNLNNLSYLSFHINLLTSIPPEIGNLSSLRTLDLSANKLTGVPSEIQNIKSLRSLVLDGNELTKVPPVIFNLTQLEVLGLSSNKLTNVPPEIENLSKLKHLSLYKNQLTNLPPEIGSLNNLEVLWLSSCALTSLPPEIGNLQNLKELDLQRNVLPNVPKELFYLNNLTELDLSSNELTDVPVDIGNLNSIERLSLSGNNFTHVPKEIGTLETLTSLDLAWNEFTSVPGEIGNLTNLTRLRLHGAKLLSLPSEITNLKSLTDAHFECNALEIEDPQVIQFLDKIQSDWKKTQTVSPKQLTVTTKTKNSISLSWFAIEYIEEQGVYEIYISKSDNKSYTLYEVTKNKTIEQMTINNLQPNTIYYIKARSVTFPHPYGYFDANNYTVQSKFTKEISTMTLSFPAATIFTENDFYIPGKTDTLPMTITIANIDNINVQDFTISASYGEVTIDRMDLNRLFCHLNTENAKESIIITVNYQDILIGSKQITADKTSPVVLIHNESYPIEPVKKHNWSWDANEPQCTFRFAIIQNEVWASQGEFSNTKSAEISTGDGIWYLHVQGKDQAGNISEVKTVNVLLDNTPPKIVGLSDSLMSEQVYSKKWYWDANEENCLFRFNISRDSSWIPSGIFQNITYAEKLNSSGTWCLHVQAKDTAGNISDVVSVSVQFNNEQPERPPAPTNLAIIKAEDNCVQLAWDVINIPGITYHVYCSEMADGFFYRVDSKTIDIFDMSDRKIQYTHKGLKNNKTYFYKVKSFANGQESEQFSNKVSAMPKKLFNFDCKAVSRCSQLIKASQSVNYFFQMFADEQFQGTIHVTCTGLSDAYFRYELINGDSRGSNLILSEKYASITLEIIARSTTPAGMYSFDLSLQNTWDAGSSQFLTIPLTLTVIPKFRHGIFVTLTNPDTNDNTRHVSKKLKKDTRNIDSPVSVYMGQPMEIYGAISSYGKNETILLSITDYSTGNAFEKNIKTTINGKFSEKQWVSSLELGTYDLTASWTDSDSNTYKSNTQSFIIQKGRSSITCLRPNYATPELNAEYLISGILNAPVSDTMILFRVISPDSTYTDHQIYMDNTHEYKMLDSFFTQNGLWQFKAYWAGDESTAGCESDLLSMPVGIEIGRAIILAGGENTLTNWDVTKKVSVSVYRYLKGMGFTDEMIYLIIHSQSIDIDKDEIPDPVVNCNLPTNSDFLNAIENIFTNDLNPETPLYIYMIGHATQDRRFQVFGYDEILTGFEIKNALDQLQAKTDCTVIFVLESCFSGNFIKDLSGPKRVILTSIGDERYSIDRKGELAFSGFLFSYLRPSKSLRAAFSYALKNMTKLGYSSPLLDDNGDFTVNEQDGTLASTIFLPEVDYGIHAYITNVDIANMLENSITTTPLSLKADGDVPITRVWAKIVPPNVNLSGLDWGISFPEVNLTFNPETDRYSGTLTHLIIPGIYKIVILAENIRHERSEPHIEYISVSGAIQPGDVNADGNISLSDVITALNIVCSGDSGISYGDLNRDGKIGLIEVLYIMKIIEIAIK
jgi:Leucine-rich repeat (LRR) protein